MTNCENCNNQINGNLDFGIYKIKHTDIEVDLNESLLTNLSILNRILKNASENKKIDFKIEKENNYINGIFYEYAKELNFPQSGDNFQKTIRKIKAMLLVLLCNLKVKFLTNLSNLNEKTIHSKLYVYENKHLLDILIYDLKISLNNELKMNNLEGEKLKIDVDQNQNSNIENNIEVKSDKNEILKIK